MQRVWPERAERLRSRGRTCMRQLGCIMMALRAPAATSKPRLRPFGCQQVSGRAPRKHFELFILGTGLWWDPHQSGRGGSGGGRLELRGT
jgi:hypothetical protein